MTSSMLFKTNEAMRQKLYWPEDQKEHFERVVRPEHVLRRKKMSQALTTYKSPLLVPKEDVTEMKKRLLYTTITAKDFGALAEQVAGATAQLALSFGLNPFNQEIWPIPQKSDGTITGFTVYVGYKGLHRAARDVARHELNSDFIFGAPYVLQPDEVSERGADRCSKCGGTGKFSEKKDCFKCDGKGKIDPALIIVVRIPLSLFCKVQMAKEHNIQFEPTWGIGVWRPGDNVPAGRDAQWVATKRAKSDALRQEFDLPFSYGESSQADQEAPEITIINPNDLEQPPIIDAAQIAGITYDDEALFIQFVEDAIQYLGFESPGHVMEAFNSMEHTNLSVDDLDVAGSVLENWLNQQEEAATPEQAELPIEEAA